MGAILGCRDAILARHGAISGHDAILPCACHFSRGSLPRGRVGRGSTGVRRPKAGESGAGRGGGEGCARDFRAKENKRTQFGPGSDGLLAPDLVNTKSSLLWRELLLQ